MDIQRLPYKTYRPPNPVHYPRTAVPSTIMNPDDMLSHPPPDNNDGDASESENESLPDLSPDEGTPDNEEAEASDPDTASLTSEETDGLDHPGIGETDLAAGDTADSTGAAPSPSPGHGNMNTSRQWHTLVGRTLQGWIEEGNTPPAHGQWGDDR